MTLIRPDRISFQARISEQELRDRITKEVLASIGALDQDGKPLPGIETKVTRGASRVGGYVIDVFSPAPPRLFLTSD